MTTSRLPARLAWLVLAALALLAIAAPALAPYPPNAMLLEQRLAAPSLAHPCGLDELGRDVLSRLLFGARASLLVGIAVVALAGSIGLLLGSVAGFVGGRVDAVLMRLTDLFLAFPGILLAIALVSVLGPALEHVVLALVLIGWVGYARLARGQTLQIAREDFVLAACASGLPAWRVLLAHVVPNVMPLLVVQASLGVAGAILAEASLSFLGLGLQPPAASWGSMINGGRSHLLDAPHVAIAPGLAIFVTVMALNFAGDALVTRLDPRRTSAKKH